MNLSKYWGWQAELDRNILEIHNLVENEELLQKKILALNVELGEVANEWRGFKFWSNKPSSPKQKILEEWVDCLHFILSIGNQLGLNKENVVFFKVDSIENHFMDCYTLTTELYDTKDANTYYPLLNNLISLAAKLGLKTEEIEAAYLSKNETNYKRQEVGY